MFLTYIMSINFFDANLDKPLELDFSDILALSKPITTDLLKQESITVPVYRKTDNGYYFIFPGSTLYSMIQMKYNLGNSLNPKFVSLSKKSSNKEFESVSLRTEINGSDVVTNESQKKPISEVFSNGPSIVFFETVKSTTEGFTTSSSNTWIIVIIIIIILILVYLYINSRKN